MIKRVAIEPPSAHYLGNELFNPDSPLNRDGTLSGFINLKNELSVFGIDLVTPDMVSLSERCDYWSFGAEVRSVIPKCDQFRPIGAALFEPPIVKPRDYLEWADLLPCFEIVMLHNQPLYDTGVQEVPTHRRLARFQKLYWPFSRDAIVTMDEFFCPNRKNKAVMIVGAHFSSESKSGYRDRANIVTEMMQGALDDYLEIYGHGWDRFNPKWLFNSGFYRFLTKTKKWPSIQSVASKQSSLLQFEFSVVIENDYLSGFITEKIFDAMSAGCIPIYKGAPDVYEYIPQEAFIDLRQFGSVREALEFAQSLSTLRRAEYREAIFRWLQDPGNPFVNENPLSLMKAYYAS